jgi:hypothetical protein
MPSFTQKIRKNALALILRASQLLHILIVIVVDFLRYFGPSSYSKYFIKIIYFITKEI